MLIDASNDANEVRGIVIKRVPYLIRSLTGFEVIFMPDKKAKVAGTCSPKNKTVTIFSTSKEEKAITLIHELAHAYLMYADKSMGPFEEPFASIFERFFSQSLGIKDNVINYGNTLRNTDFAAMKGIFPYTIFPVARSFYQQETTSEDLKEIFESSQTLLTTFPQEGDAEERENEIEDAHKGATTNLLIFSIDASTEMKRKKAASNGI